MKRKNNVIMMLVVMMTIISLVMAGCSKQNQTEPTANADGANGTSKWIVNGVDISKKVNLVGYMLGAAPAGMDLVLEKLNKKLMKDINATIDIRHISWGDLSSKYPLVLAGGGDVDFIYTANWAFYAQESTKGAFYEITDETMSKYMPRHYEAINKEAFEQAKIDDKMYMVTTASPDKKIQVAVIRGDLRKKYDVGEIKNFADLENYLEAIKKNEETMIPMYLDNSFDITVPFRALVDDASKGYIDILQSTGSGSGIYWSIEDSKPTLKTVYDEELEESFKNAAHTIKKWYDKGYINQDVFANKVRSKDSFIQGKSAVGFGNSQDMQSVLATATKNNWDIEMIKLLNYNNHYLADPYINNGVAIANNSNNPERAMLALDLIMEEPSYNNLVYFGVEGVNYEVKDSKIDLPEGVTAETNTYPPDAAGFWFTNKTQHLPLASWDEQYIALRKQLQESDILVNHRMSGFSVSLENIQTEVANLNQSVIQYLQPIGLGMVKDVDKAFDNLKNKLKAAGIEDVKKDIQEQINNYYK